MNSTWKINFWFLLGIFFVVSLIMISSLITESRIISSCNESGVYLNQNGLLVCEWRTPQKIK